MVLNKDRYIKKSNSNFYFSSECKSICLNRIIFLRKLKKYALFCKRLKNSEPIYFFEILCNF